MPALKFLAGIVIIPVVLIIVVLLGIQYFKSAYRNEQMLMKKELSELKAMPDEEIRIEAARSAKLEYPVKVPSKTPDQISKEAMDSARILAGEKFNQKNIAEQINDAMNTFKEASVGQQVEFMSKNRKGAVKGTFKGKEGIFILVDTDKYSIRDIYDEFRYLFDSDVATLKTQEKIKGIRNNFKSGADKFQEENRKRIVEELYASSGYFKTENGTWRAKNEIFEESYSALKQQKGNIRQSEILRIVQKHKLFGFFSVEPEK